jgi:3-dehydroquinate synthase
MATERTLQATVGVDTGTSRYDILIGRGLMVDASTWTGLPRASRAVIVSNSTIAPLYALRLKSALASHYPQVSVLELPDGEAHKDWPALNSIFDHLLGSGCDRKTVLFALGGGVVGDMTGFAAGCYMRGVPFVQVPTTLLAQVDSSVGGRGHQVRPHRRRRVPGLARGQPGRAAGTRQQGAGSCHSTFVRDQGLGRGPGRA